MAVRSASVRQGGTEAGAGAGGPKNPKKIESLTVPKIVAQCRKYPNPYHYTLSRTIPYLYTLNRTIPYLNILSRAIPYFNTMIRTIPYLNTLSRSIPYLNTLSRSIPYVNTLSRTIPYLNTLKKPKFTPKPNSCRQPIRIEHEKPLNLISQSESSITVPKNTRELSARVEDPSRLSRLAIAYLKT